MPISATDIQNPIDWEDPKYAGLLDDLQANILKGHGRRSVRLLFLTAVPGKAAAARAGLKALGPLVTTAKQQLEEAKLFKQTGEPGGRVILALIARAGYKAMGVKASKTPADAAFGTGMTSAAKQKALSDPKPSTWKTQFSDKPHAMILIGDASDALCSAGADAALAKLGAGWKLKHAEVGQAIFDGAGNGLEHFGYVDGRSQPLMLTQETTAEPQTNWNASFGPDIVLVDDKAGTKGLDSKGSYLVFRKLEQDVAGFKAAEAALADAQQRAAAAAAFIPAPDRELAGAMMVGRFEDGSPVIDNAAPSGADPANDFNYSADPAGRKCPLHAHVRKSNPRDGSERSRIMARRGIPYGGAEGTGAPVGLLFMAYNRDIATQFEFIQKDWVNNVNFPQGNTGLDPIIGQGHGRRAVYNQCPIAHGDPRNHAGDFQQFVTMRGGEYFFAPSISGLGNL
jgi:Dyp-type peroxidase family